MHRVISFLVALLVTTAAQAQYTPTFSTLTVTNGGTLSGTFGGTPTISGMTGVPANGGANPTTIAQFMGRVINVLDYQAACDGTTDDTAKIQNAINAAQGPGGKILVFPNTVCATTGNTISSSITIEGQGPHVGGIKLLPGSTKPALSAGINTTSWPYVPFPQVIIRNLQITGTSTDVPGAGVGHGLAFGAATSGVNVGDMLVVLENVLIFGVPGDAVHATTGAGFLEAHNVEIAYPGGAGINANSVTDWVWFGGNIYGAGNNGTPNDNIKLAGANNMRFEGVNTFVATEYDLKIFNSNAIFVNCMIDETAQHNAWIANTGQRVDFIGSSFHAAGTLANNTYSDVYMAAGNTGNVYMTGVEFPTPASSPAPNKPLANITFDAANTGIVYIDTTTNFDLGTVNTSGVTNNPSLIQTQTEGSLSVQGNLQTTGPATVLSATQFNGFAINNGSHGVASLIGSSPTNDNGSLALSNGGTTGLSLSAFGQNYMTTVLADKSSGASTTGATATVSNTSGRYLLTSGVTSPFTLTMPAAPIDGQPMLLECGKAVTLTVSPNTSQTMAGTATACSTTQGHSWHYHSGDTTWYMDY